MKSWLHLKGEKHTCCSQVRTDSTSMTWVTSTTSTWKNVREASIRTNQNSWKDKILNYEIETNRQSNRPKIYRVAWKDKILDYEVETAVNDTEADRILNLKRQDSQLRNWNKQSAVLSFWVCKVFGKGSFSETKVWTILNDTHFAPLGLGP